MIFQFSTFNHCRQGQIIVEDITRILGAQLKALGHDAIYVEEPNFVRGEDAYNVVLESFADNPDTLWKIGAAHAEGCRFLIVATEEPTENGFNHGLEPAMIDRQNAFAAAAKFADGILHLVPGERITAWYGQHAPAAYVELGYAESLVDPGDTEPTAAFGFYGKMTWRREQMLTRLESMCGKVIRIESLDVPRDQRAAIMRSAKVIVQIRANEEWGMVSSTRCATALSFGRPVVAEPHPHPAPWDRIVHFSKTVEEFYYDATAATETWQRLHRVQLERFRSILTPEVCVHRALQQIGIIGG